MRLASLSLLPALLAPALLSAQVVLQLKVTNQSSADWQIVSLARNGDTREMPSLEVTQNGNRVGIVKLPDSTVKLGAKQTYLFKYHQPEKLPSTGGDLFEMVVNFKDAKGKTCQLTVGHMAMGFASKDMAGVDPNGEAQIKVDADAKTVEITGASLGQ